MDVVSKVPPLLASYHRKVVPFEPGEPESPTVPVPQVAPLTPNGEAGIGFTVPVIAVLLPVGVSQPVPLL